MTSSHLHTVFLILCPEMWRSPPLTICGTWKTQHGYYISGISFFRGHVATELGANSDNNIESGKNVKTPREI